MERLQKVMAQAGLCSRRTAEKWILEGRVKINGEVCHTLGTKVSGNDRIDVDGKTIEKEQYAYYVFYKPKGTICSVNDDKGRKTVLDYMPKDTRLYPVGRLDYDTTGILLMTNDGEFTNMMTHPKYHLPKVYVISLQGILEKEDIKKLRKGFGDYQPAKVYILETDMTRQRMRLELTIFEGKNHQIKNMMSDLGCEVRKLHRKQFGFIDLGQLHPGQYRKLKMFEVKQLKRYAMQGDTL